MTRPPAVYWDEPEAAGLQLMPRPRWSASRVTTEQTTVYRLAVRHWSVSRHQTVTVHRVNTLTLPPWRRQQCRPSPTVCFPHSPCTAAGAITRDGVTAAAGHHGYLTATVKVVYFRPAGSNFDYRLLTG